MDSGMSVVVKKEPAVETGLSSYSPGTLAFNCYYCTYKTTDPVEYADHIRAHTARAADEDADSVSVGTANSQTSADNDLLPHLGQASIVLIDIMKMPCDELAQIMQENGIRTVQ